MICFCYIACDVSITLAEQTSTIIKKYDFTFAMDTVILELTVYTGGFAHGIYLSPFQAMHDLISYIF